MIVDPDRDRYTYPGDQHSQTANARALQIANRLRIAIPKQPLQTYGNEGRGRYTYIAGFLELAEVANETLLLDIIDAAIADYRHPVNARHHVREPNPETPEHLDRILHNGGSAYRVNDNGTGLELRVPDTVREAVTMASTVSGDPQEHLVKAWQATYGLHPQPSVAYAEAVKAIEAAVIPVVIPADTRATLGKAISHLKNAADKWELGIVDQHGDPARITALIEILELIWHGQRDRHAGTPTALTVTRQAAEMAVHAAALATQWINGGGLRKRI
jgi:hypothetical protein